jgi:small subunit ribosomal protein S1
MPDDTFAALFEAQAGRGPSGHRSVQVGDTLEAIVVQVGKDTIFLELDGKRQAMLDRVEVQKPDGTVDVKAGDVLRAKVIEVDAQSGQVRLGRSFGKSGDLAHIQQALDAGVPIEGKVTGTNKGGLEVDLGKGSRGFCPNSQISLRGAPPADLVGQSVSFLVTEIKDGGRSIVLSRRRLLEAEAREGRGAAPEGQATPTAKFATGSIVKGKVVRVESYGVFVQVEGTEGRDGRGLVPVSELNAPQGADLRRRFPEGTELTARVLETGDGRLKLSVRGALDAAERADFEAHKEVAQSPAGFGTLGDLLRKSKKG